MPPKHRILIVEDEAIIARNLGDAVADVEAEPIGPVASVAEALALLATTPINGAVLDADLFDGVVTPLALHLLDLGVPFAIHTGTGLPVDLAARPLDVPLVMNPPRPQALSRR